MITTKIWIRDKYRNINPENPPKETRELDSFLFYNGAAKCFIKAQGGWYKLTREGKLLFVTRALYLMSLNQFLEIAKNDNFIANNQ
jgi:hemin uptake protein HemP